MAQVPALDNPFTQVLGNPAKVFNVREDPYPIEGTSNAVCHPNLNYLQDLFTHMRWNIYQFPEQALLCSVPPNGQGGAAITRPITTHELAREICAGELILNLPLNPKAPDISLLQETSIVGERITVYDIMYRIWKWYNIFDIDVPMIESLRNSKMYDARAKALFLEFEQGKRYLRLRDFIPSGATDDIPTTNAEVIHYVRKDWATGTNAEVDIAAETILDLKWVSGLSLEPGTINSFHLILGPLNEVINEKPTA